MNTCEQLVFFWYEHAKDGLVWPKKNIENLYSSKCALWNNLSG
jgi:hypothetical protein